MVEENRRIRRLMAWSLAYTALWAATFSLALFFARAGAPRWSLWPLLALAPVVFCRALFLSAAVGRRSQAMAARIEERSRELQRHFQEMEEEGRG